MTLETIEQTRLSEPTDQELAEAAEEGRIIAAEQRAELLYSMLVGVRDSIDNMLAGLRVNPGVRTVSTEYEALTCEDSDIDF